MRPIHSPLLSATLGAVFGLTGFVGVTHAQTTTTTTERTTTQTTVTQRVAQPKSIVTTEIEFQPASTAKDLNTEMLRDFQNVKHEDSKISHDIALNPAVVQDSAYVGKHPALMAFLEKYPDARGEIVANPGNFVTPVAGSKWNSHEAAGIPRD